MKQKIGRSYIKCRLKWIAAVTGCGIVMTAVLFLNEVPAGEIAYGMLLCLGILLLAVTMDRISYGRRHRELLALRQSITVSLENLPEPGEILEEDYINSCLDFWRRRKCVSGIRRSAKNAI